MRARAATALGCSLSILVVLLLGGLSRLPVWSKPVVRLENQATEAQRTASVDEFGIRFLHPTLRDGTYWTSSWDTDRAFPGVDPQDAWFDADHGTSTYEVSGGRLVISGPTPRMYVHDPALRRQWRDVEVTMYVQRVADSDIPYSGFTAVARSNHLKTEDGSADRCDTRGYGARLRFDGHVDFEKETAHPRNQAISNRELFPGGMPTDAWIGVKYLVYDRADGVHLEMWVDLREGKDGGDWRMVNEVVDDGRLFGDVPCAIGIDPAMPLTGAPTRTGSESGTPNASVYFRSDGIAPAGLLYKWGSIREVSP